MAAAKTTEPKVEKPEVTVPESAGIEGVIVAKVDTTVHVLDQETRDPNEEGFYRTVSQMMLQGNTIDPNIVPDYVIEEAKSEESLTLYYCDSLEAAAVYVKEELSKPQLADDEGNELVDLRGGLEFTFANRQVLGAGD